MDFIHLQLLFYRTQRNCGCGKKFLIKLDFLWVDQLNTMTNIDYNLITMSN